MLLRRLAFGYLIKRLLDRRSPGSEGRTTYGPPGTRVLEAGRSRRGRGGFFGPFPYYSTRTRRGTRVSVGGCCLPLGVVLIAAPALGVVALRRR